MGLVTTMVSFYDQQQGAQSAPTSPSHEHMPVGLPESPLAKAVQRPSSASRSRAAMDSTERPSPTSISRQSSLPNVARRQDISAQGHVNSDCLASPGRARSNIEGTNPLDNLATSQAPTDVSSRVDDQAQPSSVMVHSGKESVGSRDCVAPHSAPSHSAPLL